MCQCSVDMAKGLGGFQFLGSRFTAGKRKIIKKSFYNIVLVVRKKDDRNKKTSHLILEMTMNEAFIWLFGLCFIDQKNY